MKPADKKSSIVLRCPACAEVLDHTQIKKPFLPFLFHPGKIRCPACGHFSEYKEAQIMAESFQHWTEQLRHQVEASLSYLPVMTREECFAVLNPKHFDDDIHHVHQQRDLIKYLTQVFKPVLRDRALGHEDCELLLSPHAHHGVAKGLNIYGHCGHDHSSEAWTLLITRFGSKEFLTCVTTSIPKADLTSIMEIQGAVSIWPTA
ncbi:MAG: hypothetical protein ACP5VQ_02995, partial [Phycisphaerae bacterium]